jgi:hypothetical protein
MIEVNLATYNGESLETIGSIGISEDDWPDELSEKQYTALLSGHCNAPENNVEAFVNEDGFVLESDFHNLGRIVEETRIEAEYGSD